MVIFKKSILLIILGILCFPSMIFSQKNKLEIQVGPLHTFFWKTPLIEKKYAMNTFPNKLGKRIRDSWHLSYAHSINQKSDISMEIAWFYASYKTKQIIEDGISPQISQQQWFTYNLSYTRFKKINDKLKISFGAGVNYRKGFERIHLYLVPLGPEELGLTEIVSYNGGVRKDFGLNVFSGLYYQLSKKIFITTKLDFLTLIYIYDKDYIEAMKSDYFNSPQYPSRYDMSIKFGIGLNF